MEQTSMEQRMLRNYKDYIKNTPKLMCEEFILSADEVNPKQEGAQEDLPGKRYS